MHDQIVPNSVQAVFASFGCVEIASVLCMNKLRIWAFWKR